MIDHGTDIVQPAATTEPVTARWHRGEAHTGHRLAHLVAAGFGTGHQHDTGPPLRGCRAWLSARMWSASSAMLSRVHVSWHSAQNAIASASFTRRPPRTPHSGRVLSGSHAGESHPVWERAQVHQRWTSRSRSWASQQPGFSRCRRRCSWAAMALEHPADHPRQNQPLLLGQLHCRSSQPADLAAAANRTNCSSALRSICHQIFGRASFVVP